MERNVPVLWLFGLPYVQKPMQLQIVGNLVILRERRAGYCDATFISLILGTVDMRSSSVPGNTVVI